MAWQLLHFFTCFVAQTVFALAYFQRFCCLNPCLFQAFTKCWLNLMIGLPHLSLYLSVFSFKICYVLVLPYDRLASFKCMLEFIFFKVLSICRNTTRLAPNIAPSHVKAWCRTVFPSSSTSPEKWIAKTPKAVKSKRCSQSWCSQRCRGNEPWRRTH